MPYRHPGAVTANLLWWGLFLGCLGASLGALLGLWAEQAPADGKPDLGSGFPDFQESNTRLPLGPRG
jgi:hypothetical protein